MNLQTLPAIATLEGEVLREAVLDANEMCSMNFAREECAELEKILLTFVIPAMGGYNNELACDIARHLEQIRTFSGNFCWRHRHLGASYGVVGKRCGIDNGGAQ
ncbi:hypothetical protein C4K19_0358 [Pseudomonas chlororaphis subsp. aurantiaca]|uniref:hypothetical protein n=1 Tax=Pseudomonas chlororaphis TaxID=587753 RepID=UPI000F56D6E4|nr:hypothetical protein [Pseudomonas chlororaphis]AZD52176.1 hypothetical protein C4K19_0358 [Pseudomonas chlororaphis subsp. aurantiaca]AZD58355.1 hypothetical protein C4K18_0351 [Pseudomonas chlororaphis subsp. aurantiaca]